MDDKAALAEGLRDFVTRTELQDIFLVDIEAHRPKAPKNLSIKAEFHSERLNSPQDQVRVLFTIDISGSGVEESAEGPGLHIKAAFQVLYVFKGEEPNEEVLQAFLQRNVALNAWPYCREIVAAMTQRMSMPPLVLPVFRVY